MIMLATILSGCSLSVTTYSWEIQEAAKFCGGLEKVSTIYFQAVKGTSIVTCTDGSRTWLRNRRNAESAN
jgi:hypothetical protein